MANDHQHHNEINLLKEIDPVSQLYDQTHFLIQSLEAIQSSKKKYPLEKIEEKITPPFFPLYQSIIKFRDNFDKALQIKEKAENDLHEQNKFNQVRAEIWKIASDLSLEEKVLIQKLLNKVGPAIGVSRACYNTYLNESPESQDVVCTIEWCDDGVKPSVGMKLPHLLVKHLTNKDFFLLSPEIALDMIPKPLRPLAKPMITVIARDLNLDYASALPHYVNDKIKGWFTFDVCKDNKNKPKMTKEIKSVIREMVDITAKHIEQKEAEDALKKAYDEMELRVHERTEQLKIVNEKLQKELIERQNIEEELRNHTNNLEKIVKDKTQRVLTLERKKLNLEKMAAIGRATSYIVHELRNPLSTIKSGITSLANRLVLKDKNKHCLTVSIREMNHMENMLKEMLNFTKPQQMFFKEQDIHTIINRSIENNQNEIDNLNIEIQRKFSSGLPPVKIDFEKMYQVFSNLINNALQAMSKGGRIQIKTKYKENQNTINISFKDNGIGIDKENLKHLFEPFFTCRAGGTGLGLTVVERIIKDHKGTVHITSQIEKWTTVNLTLPTSITSEKM